MSNFFNSESKKKHADYNVLLTAFQQFVIKSITRQCIFLGPRRVGKTYVICNYTPAYAHHLKYLHPRGMISAPELSQVKDLYWDEMIENCYKYPQFKADNKANVISWVRYKQDTGMMRDDKVSIKFRGMHKNPLSLRGTYLDFYINDETQDTNLDKYTTVIRPQTTFSKISNMDYDKERKGWSMFMGTARENHIKDMFFKYLKKANEGDTNYTAFRTSASKMKHISQEELDIALEEMGPEDYAQEYESQFISSLTSKVFDRELKAIRDRAGFKVLLPSPRVSTIVAMDIGLSDATAMWFCQKVGGRYHVVDFYKEEGLTPEKVLEIIKDKAHARGFNITHVGLPHDSKRKYFQTVGSMTSFEYFSKFKNLFKTVYLERWRVIDSINWTRSFMATCDIDEDRCFDGVVDLREYSFKYIASQDRYDYSAIKKSKHSHGSDGFRYLAQLAHKVTMSGEWDIINSGDMVTHEVEDYTPAGYGWED